MTIAAVLVVAVIMAGDDTNPAATGRAARTRNTPGDSVPLSDVKLELLKQGRSELAPPERDPFRFQARVAPPEAPGAAPPPRVAAPPVVTPAPVPTGPPPPPPIPLKFIGLVDAPSQAGRVAILSDGRGNVLHGKEGDTIEGRYRLLRVGVDAVELAYVDGRGQQTVRLAGQ